MPTKPKDRTTKFRELSEYNEELSKGYKLLPFRFIALDEKRYVLTNEVGEFLIADRAGLNDLVNKKLTAGSSFYNDLKSKHFLYDSDTDVALELLALKIRSRYAQIANFTGLHMFVVTLRCDHSCPYCQVSRQSEDREAFDMSKDTASKCLDMTFKTPAKSVKIEFQGGEPLLNFELIKWIVCEARLRNEVYQKDIQFVIATNLSQLTDEILQFAVANDILFSTSLDGPEELHIKNRPRPGNDSFRKTIDGIKKIRSDYGVQKVSALMTTTQASLEQPRQIVDEYIKQGFYSIFLRPLSPYGFAVKTKWFEAYDVDDWLKFYFEGLEYIIELNKRGMFFVEEYAGIILQKMFSPMGTTYVDLQSPAGLGISALAFNYDGEVYASDEARMLAEMGDKTFRLGNIHNETYEEMMLSPNLLDALEFSISESAPACNQCAFQPYCGSDPTYHYATQRDYVGHKALSGFCKRNMAIFRHLIQRMENDVDVKNILLSWVRI